MPGSSYGDTSNDAIYSSTAFLLVLSSESNRSALVTREVELALKLNLPILPVLIEPVVTSYEIRSLIGPKIWLDISNEKNWYICLQMLDNALATRFPQKDRSKAPLPLKSKEAATKGYVFISYSREDSDFVVSLKEILKKRGYSYWDYSESERDYHGALYKELEEKIENAKAFMCIVTDNWRESEWPAAECVYARESKVPIFVIQAKKLQRPVPIIINLQTRINMEGDFSRGASVLEHELDKKGL